MQYRPMDRMVLLSTVAAVTRGPVAIFPGHLLLPVPQQDAQPRQPAAIHTPTPPLAAAQLYAVVAAPLADGGKNFCHPNGPVLVTGNIPRPQNDAPHPQRNTLHKRTRTRDTNREAPPPGPQQANRLVVQAAGY